MAIFNLFLSQIDLIEPSKRIIKSLPDNSARNAWFSAVAPVQCDVAWTEARENQTWSGLLDRVAAFDEDSRTITVVVRVDGLDPANRSAGLPLVEGMYCHVSIPGITLENVFAIPDSAITVDGSVYCVHEGRLETRPVRIVRRVNGPAYIDA